MGQNETAGLNETVKDKREAWCVTECVTAFLTPKTLQAHKRSPPKFNNVLFIVVSDAFLGRNYFICCVRNQERNSEIKVRYYLTIFKIAFSIKVNRNLKIYSVYQAHKIKVFFVWHVYFEHTSIIFSYLGL